MRYFIYTFAIILLLAFNIEFANLFAGTPMRINFLLLLTVFSALEKDSQDYIFMSIFSGLMLDFYNSASFGNFLLSLVVLSFLIHWIANIFSFTLGNWKTIVILAALTAIYNDIFMHIYAFFSPNNFINLNYYIINQKFIIVLYFMFLQVLAAIPIYLFWQWIKEIIQNWENKKFPLRI